MNAGFVAKVDKSTKSASAVRIVYGGIAPHAVSNSCNMIILSVKTM